MIIHFIALVIFNNKKYGYHYSSSDSYKVISKKNELIKASNSKEYSFYNFHYLRTNDFSYQSVQHLDPYFGNVKFCGNITKFLHMIDEHVKLTDLDVASYIMRKFSINSSYELQKTLYYVYAECLRQFGEDRKVFNADFLTYQKGPVDSKLYGVYKHDKKQLFNVDFEKKISIISNKNKFLSIINDIVRKYGKYFRDTWNNQKMNLTHKPDIPWSLTYKKYGQNAEITDDDIIKYHQNEE